MKKPKPDDPEFQSYVTKELCDALGISPELLGGTKPSICISEKVFKKEERRIKKFISAIDKAHRDAENSKLRFGPQSPAKRINKGRTT